MKIGLVLSGGGMLGAAHIGAIKALEECGIIATHIAGTSLGAIVGAFYAYGFDWQDILKFLKGIQLINITKYALNKPGFIDAEKFYSEFKAYLKEDDFSALEKKLIVTATDILTGKLELFTEGELIRPVLASAALPGLFAPVKINESYYIDGGAMDNFPVSALKEECDIIIGVYVNGYEALNIKDLKHSYNVVERAFKLKSVKEDIAKFKDCDLVVYPKELSQFGTFNKKNIMEIFKIGYESTIAALKSEKGNSIKAFLSISSN